jgi:transcriptional regulator with XRE-family HTH domain
LTNKLMPSMTSQVMACQPALPRIPGVNSPATHRSPSVRDPFGPHLRYWRQLRRMSQLDLAAEAALSTRHLSCVETGRATPSREVVLRLAERLEVPLRERNGLLVAAGYAPMYRQRALDDPALAAARQAIELLLKAHEPWPALAIDRHWNLVAHNAMLPMLLQGLPPELVQRPLNVLRLSLHPQGLAPRIANLGPWRAHVLARLRQQVESTGDAMLEDLLGELAALPLPPGTEAPSHGTPADALAGVVVPFVLRSGTGLLSFISTTTIFGTPVDVTLQEFALETFLPADAQTAAAMTALAKQASG